MKVTLGIVFNKGLWTKFHNGVNKRKDPTKREHVSYLVSKDGSRKRECTKNKH